MQRRVNSRSLPQARAVAVHSMRLWDRESYSWHSSDLLPPCYPLPAAFVTACHCFRGFDLGQAIGSGLTRRVHTVSGSGRGVTTGGFASSFGVAFPCSLHSQSPSSSCCLYSSFSSLATLAAVMLSGYTRHE